MKPYLLSILFAAFSAVLGAGEKGKSACTCTAGGTCTCPAGECKCAAAAEGKNCGCACCEGKATCCCHGGEESKDAEKPAGHALKGRVVDVLADKKALLVRHEEIPGVMKAMTMLFRVDDATLAAVKKGDSITARMTNEEGAWWLHEVKPAGE